MRGCYHIHEKSEMISKTLTSWEQDFELIPTIKMETRHPLEIYFGREFPVVSLRSSGSQFAKSWKFARNFCVFWKNDPYDKIFKIMFGKFTSRHRSTLLCAKFVKTVGREIVRYLPDKNFVSLSNCRYCADRVQSLLWRVNVQLDPRHAASKHTPKICAESDPPPFGAQRFRPISAHSASTVTASEKKFN